MINSVDVNINFTNFFVMNFFIFLASDCPPSKEPVSQLEGPMQEKAIMLPKIQLKSISHLTKSTNTASYKYYNIILE
jgi:hypothetical protein